MATFYTSQCQDDVEVLNVDTENVREFEDAFI